MHVKEIGRYLLGRFEAPFLLRGVTGANFQMGGSLKLHREAFNIAVRHLAVKLVSMIWSSLRISSGPGDLPLCTLFIRLRIP